MAYVFQNPMRIESSAMILLILTTSLSGCMKEEFCGDVATFDSELPIGTDYAISVLEKIPCATAGPTAVGAGCWIVKSAATIYDKTTELCLGFEVGTCIYSTATNGSNEGCEEARDLAPDAIKIAFTIHEVAQAPSVGDVGNDLSDFAPLSYLVVDDFSSTTWEFHIDEEGNISHFF